MAAQQPSEGSITIVGTVGTYQTEINFKDLGDDESAEVIPDLLADYQAECKDWTAVAREHWRCGRWNRAEDLIRRGIKFFASGRQPDHMALVNLYAMLGHLHLTQSRTAPKTVLQNAKFDVLPGNVGTKEYHYTEATANFNRADEALRSFGTGPEDEPVSVAMGKIILYLARGQPGVASPLVDRLLKRQPNNLSVLMAHARLQFARREHDAALVTYQKILSLSPDVQPDPRIGIGLCAYVLGDKERAHAAWERAQRRDSTSWAPPLLLGLSSLNMARDPSVPLPERVAFESQGVDKVSAAFRLNNKSAAAALALAAVCTLGREVEMASKLAERAIQYSDNRRHSVLANSERGRLGFIAGELTDAARYIGAAKTEDPNTVNVMAELTLAQIAIKNGNLREALNFVEQTAKRLNGKGPLEFTVLHASLLAYPHLGMPADEAERNLKSARTMLGDVQNLMSNAETEEDWAKLRGVANDADAFVELAKLWQKESIEKAITSYQTAIQIKAEAESDDAEDTQAESQVRTKPVDYDTVRLSTNLASLYALQGESDSAESMFLEALQRLASANGKEADELKTVLAYDLGRACEQGGDTVKAQQWYRDVLGQHPEHMESKVRLAVIARIAGRNVDAHNYLKECLRADETNVTLRSVYTNFLISLGSYKEALQFTSQTLKYERHDVYTFTALGWLHFNVGREAKSQQDVAERSKQYLRSAEAYERALSVDPTNAIAAQGLVIALTEDTLTPKALQVAPGSVEEMKNRTRLAGQALSVLGRIKDSLPEGAVNVNIGHCCFIRGEEERAIEAYGSALSAANGRSVPILLYLCRAWFSYANKETNFSAMGQALHYAQRAMHLQPSDRAILYNIAMIQQKAAEIMLGLEPSRRMLDELKLALKRATEAVGIFRALADDKTRPLPYDPEVADHRARYGESLVRKGPEAIATQEEFESEAAARVEEARRMRAAEQERITAAAAARQAEIEERAAEITEQRLKAREEARAFHEQLNTQIREEEERKAERIEQRKRRKDADGVVEDGEERPRKRGKKGGKKKKRKDESQDEDEIGESAPLSAADDDDDDPESGRRRAQARLAASRAKKSKKNRHEDPDDEEDTGTRRGKQFKSKAIIEDSDDEDEDEEMAPTAPSPPSTPGAGSDGDE
ncbi:uncharacterized protein CcaverHIS019_0504740 [Cutaneotrichosporon cavernicola]|uniref:TPR-like protein n=1 Tax=Cutaneotrichosporon cavernicola TaxID=279322 RepID=A0AA48L6I8_9TREE|nr:uncharacterized protein CcaverHIS019_0504740 [Cutaneotrichosporon cavernicola]BEI92846.1 hypothetical protein CcaverHIS019_0504740 [Cutaneotrichosporon cavernicola]